MHLIPLGRGYLFVRQEVDELTMVAEQAIVHRENRNGKGMKGSSRQWLLLGLSGYTLQFERVGGTLGRRYLVLGGWGGVEEEDESVGGKDGKGEPAAGFNGGQFRNWEDFLRSQGFSTVTVNQI